MGCPRGFCPHISYPRLIDLLNIPSVHRVKMPAQAALLIGPIVHAQREWEGLSSILTLKVRTHIHALVCLLRIRNSQPALAMISYATANRGTTTTLLPSTGRTPRPRYADVIGTWSTQTNGQFTGPFDAELLSALPASLKYICHNGAGYDNVDVGACSQRGIRVSSTPIAVNHATADVGIFLMIGALRQAYVPISALRAGMCVPIYYGDG